MMKTVGANTTGNVPLPLGHAALPSHRCGRPGSPNPPRLYQLALPPVEYTEGISPREGDETCSARQHSQAMAEATA
jgi:hypothetical protein